MSAASLTRIMEETSAKLAAAPHGDETLAVGVDHMTRIGVDLAEVVFATFRTEPYTNEQINVAILKTLDCLNQSIVESFEAFGITEHPFLDRCLEAATSGFLDRGEALFSAETGGGWA